MTPLFFSNMYLNSFVTIKYIQKKQKEELLSTDKKRGYMNVTSTKYAIECYSEKMHHVLHSLLYQYIFHQLKQLLEFLKLKFV